MQLMPLFLTLLVLTASFGAKAQEVTWNALIGSTLFTKNSLDRFYIAPDNSFTQQLQTPWQNKQAGDFIKGQWRLSNDLLCLQYRDIPDSDFCLELEKRGERAYVASLSQNDRTKMVFRWGDAKQGNWLLKPSVVGHFLSQTKEFNESQTNKVADYFINTVYAEPTSPITFYTVSKDKTLAYLKDKKSVVPLNWSIKNSYIRFWNTHYDVDDIYKMTLGDEFYEQKPQHIYFYYAPHRFLIEGEDLTVLPLDQSPDKDIFLPYLNADGTIKDGAFVE